MNPGAFAVPGNHSVESLSSYTARANSPRREIGT
jgi:hypothetical protein